MVPVLMKFRGATMVAPLNTVSLEESKSEGSSLMRNLTHTPLERETLYDCYREEIKTIHERIEQY